MNAYIATTLPLPSELNQTTLQNSLLAIGSIKALITMTQIQQELQELSDFRIRLEEGRNLFQPSLERYQGNVLLGINLVNDEVSRFV